MENLPALQEYQVENLIAQAIDKNVSVESLERLLAMRKELKAEYAAEQFNIAMAEFQYECPAIKKTKVVTTNKGQVAYKYAPIDSIIHQVKPYLQKHGFSYSINTHTGDKLVTAVCTAKHILGHKESSDFSVPLGTQTAVMSDSQVVAAALQFAKRYAFCNAFGIMTSDQDTDGAYKQPEKEDTPATHEQISDIRFLLAETKIKEEALLKKYGVSYLSDLTISQAAKAIKSFNAYLNKQNAKNEVPDGEEN